MAAKKKDYEDSKLDKKLDKISGFKEDSKKDKAIDAVVSKAAGYKRGGKVVKKGKK